MENARSYLRMFTGNAGRAHSISDKSQYRPPRKPGQLQPLPKFIEESWEPFEIDAKRNLVFGDPHIPFASKLAFESMLRFADEYNPHSIFVNGDWFDFYQISKFVKNPTIAHIEHELAVSTDTWAHLTQRYPRAKRFLKKGNHDERWESYIFTAAPLLSGVPQVVDAWMQAGGLSANGVTVIGDRRPVMLGNLPVLHGHELGKGAASPVSPARGAFLKTQHTIMVNHWHRTSGSDHSDMFNAETYCWSLGCMCGLHPAYRPVNNWNWGFATVGVESNGEFSVQNYRINKHGKVRKA